MPSKTPHSDLFLSLDTQSASIKLDGSNLLLSQLVNISRSSSSFHLDESLRPKVEKSEQVLKEAVKDGKTVYVGSSEIEKTLTWLIQITIEQLRSTFLFSLCLSAPLTFTFSMLTNRESPLSLEALLIRRSKTLTQFRKLFLDCCVEYFPLRSTKALVFQPPKKK